MREVHDMASITIRVHKETLEAQLQKILGNKAKEVLSDDVKRRAAEIYRDCVEYWVPEDSGNLRKSAEVVPHKGTYGVEYDTSKVDPKGKSYGKPQYEGKNGSIWPESMWNRKNKHTSSHWNRRMSRTDREIYYDLVKEEILENLNHG